VLSTDFEARVRGLQPAASGVEARALDGDLLLELRVAPSRVVVVLGYLDEPFLRFSPAGVEANLASPTAGSARIIGAADGVSSSRVRWQRIRRGHVLAWHDNRLRPVPTVRTRSQQPRVVGTWSIPLVVDGRDATLVGSEWYASGPSPWPWLAAGALLVAVAAIGGRRLSARAQRLIAPVLLAIAVAGLFTSWAGIILAGRATLPAMSLAIAFAIISGVFLFIVITAAPRSVRPAVMALIGGFVATFAVPELAIFGHGFVLSELPALAARLTVASAVAGGLAVTALCARAVMEFLSAGRARKTIIGVSVTGGGRGE
jgi:hypothetical protein